MESGNLPLMGFLLSQFHLIGNSKFPYDRLATRYNRGRMLLFKTTVCKIIVGHFSYFFGRVCFTFVIFHLKTHSPAYAAVFPQLNLLA